MVKNIQSNNRGRNYAQNYDSYERIPVKGKSCYFKKISVRDYEDTMNVLDFAIARKPQKPKN